MKRALVTTVFVVLVTFACMIVAQAEVSSVLTVNVPFSFTVGKAVLPAGQYTVQIDRMGNGTAFGSSLTLRDKDGALVQRVHSRPDLSKMKSGASLLFRKYADSYFLAKVESYGLGCELARTRAEKEMASRPSQGTGTVTVAAE